MFTYLLSFTQIPMKKILNYIVLGAMFLLILSMFTGLLPEGGVQIAGGREDAATRLMREAYEARIKAQAEHCKDIGENYLKCYSAPASEKETCLSGLETLKTNFFNEYGEYDTLACTTQQKPFFVEGVAQ